MDNDKANFSYLSGDGFWPDFAWDGLELLSDGALQLQSLPLFEGELPDELAAAPAPEGPAGVAVDVDGTVYYTDASTHKILIIDGCDGAIAEANCIGGKGDGPTELNMPRGLLLPKYRRSLFVADSANNRVQVFDLASSQLVDIWGQRGGAGETEPGSEAGRLNKPWTMAGDTDGNVYVVDYGNRRVQKFNRVGDVVPAFGKSIEQSGALQKPSDIAVYSDEQSTVVYILDEASHSIFVFDADGHPVRDALGQALSFGSEQLSKPMGMAAGRDAVYVGDNARRRVLKFRRRDYSFVGVAVGYQGPVAALALDNQGDLLVHAGAGFAPLRLAIGKGYRARGALWSRVIRLRKFKVSWYRLQAEVRQLTQNAHLRLFVHTSNDETDGPAVDPGNDDPFADPRWRPRSEGPDQFSNVQDLYIGGEPSEFIWIGGLFSADGQSTPVVSQLRVDFDHDDYRQRLPEIYRGDAPCGDFLRRFLSLFESLFGELESSIEDLSQLFDPVAAPKEFLAWLAGWLALEMDEDWSEQQQRDAIASAFAAYSRRGTVEGLRQSLRIFADVNAIIEEPIANAAWWATPAADVSCKCEENSCNCKNDSRDFNKQKRASKETEWIATENSILGVTTMLAPAHAQGAVIGSTATLDGSHLITNEEFGAPLFEDVANQFSVQIYRGQLACPETLPEVRAVIEREKPAHTTYHLCIIEPRMRVGFQARVGIDAVVAAPPTRMGLGEQMLGEDTALGGPPAGRIGEESRVGITTRVG